MKAASEIIKQSAFELGFDQVGLTSLGGLEEDEKRLEAWIEEGRHGSMKYLQDFQDRRSRLLENFPGAKSVIVLGVNYFSPSPISSPPEGERIKERGLLGRIARYAWGRDYHTVIREKHAAFIHKLKSEWGEGVQAESCVDTKPLPERAAARLAGVGFIGKNTMLLSRRFGPWLFLSEIVTNLDLGEDLPDPGSCGTCVKCQKVCPTGALDEDYRMDARLCIAYLTIEHKGVIPRGLRPKIKNWLFGCDECLSICPFTSHEKETGWKEFRAEAGVGDRIDLDELFSLRSNREYEKKYQGTALLRASRKQMLRNACIVLGNSGDEKAVPLLEKAMQERSALVRLHAAWGLGQIVSGKAENVLKERSLIESDAEVLKEIEFALEGKRFSGGDAILPGESQRGQINIQASLP